MWWRVYSLGVAGGWRKGGPVVGRRQSTASSRVLTTHRHNSQPQEMTFNKQKEMGIFPQDATLSERPEQIPAWDETPEEERAVYARFMEVGGACGCGWQLTRLSSSRRRMAPFPFPPDPSCPAHDNSRSFLFSRPNHE